MINFQIDDKLAAKAVEEIFREIRKEKFADCTVVCTPCSEGLKAERNGNRGKIEYCDRRALLRAAVFFAQKKEKVWRVEEKNAVKLLCAMPDVSRNAVPTVQTLKQFYRLLAMEGYNSVMLYTEDTYELPGYPYFGHLRGRYTKEELTELDDYADLLGLEMIPCIQTLAHLNGFLEWPASGALADCNDILLAGDEKVYELVESMLVYMKNTLRSRKINIGLDEAFMLGCGQYLEKNGYVPRSTIMLEHLKKVAALCEKLGYQPRMWSDMFFRMNNRGVYRVPGTDIPKEIAAEVPENVTLIYWDYYQPEKSLYHEMFRQHKVFNNKIAFAGGDSSWYGLVPLNRYSKVCCQAAMESVIENQIDEVYVTMWGDDGGACSLFSTMNTLFDYAERCWDPHFESCRERLLTCTGMKEEELLDFEELYHLPGRKAYGMQRPNPGKYIFYENILTGKFDYHIPDGTEEQMRKVAKRLLHSSGSKGKYGYLFKAVAAFADAVAEKAELGKQIHSLYQAGNKTAVFALLPRIALVERKVQKFRKVFREQWFSENKSFGFDVMDVRIGGLLAQLNTASFILREWISGKRDHIDELDAPRLPYGFEGDKGYDNNVLLVNRWQRIAGQNISNMF